MAASEVETLAELLGQVEVAKRIEVDLKDQKLKLDTAEDAKDVVENIRSCEEMTTLTLSGNTIGVEAAKAIAEALESKATFEHALWSDIFTGRLRAEIPPSLTALSSAIMKSGAQLTELDLSDNAFGPDGVKACVDLLTSTSAYSLKVLKFNNIGLGIGGGQLLAKALEDCHTAASEAGRQFSLKVFIAGRNRLENEGATALAGAFKMIGTLRYLSMPQNGFHHPGISALADALTHNRQLQHLDLNDNTFTERGSEAMAQALPMLQELEVINFGDCLVKSKGATAIAEALRDGHTVLKELYLTYDEMDRESGLKVVSALENKSNLQKVHMNGNRFGSDGIKDIRLAVKGFNLSHSVLDSLSDDEGDASDDEDDDEGVDTEDGQSSGVEDVSVREETGGTVSVDPALLVRGVAIGTPLANGRTQLEDEVADTAAQFLENPTANGLIALGNDRVNLVRKELENKARDTRTTVAVFCNVSSILVSQDESLDVVTAANQISDAVLEPAFVRNSSEVLEEILSQLGLIKSEDKIQPIDKVQGPLLALQHVVKQSYFPKSSVDTLIAFLSKPSTRLDSAPEARHRLMQALYSR